MIQWAGATFEYPVTFSQLDKYLFPTYNDPPNRFAYKVVRRKNNTTVGHIDIDSVSYSMRKATLCRILVGDPDMRGKGIGEEIVQSALKICFQQLNLHRVDLRVFAFNISAIRCYKKAGFQIEGTFRDFVQINGRYEDCLQMSILEDEWNLS